MPQYSTVLTALISLDGIMHSSYLYHVLQPELANSIEITIAIDIFGSIAVDETLLILIDKLHFAMRPYV